MRLIIDTCSLVDASGQGVDAYAKDSLDLLELITKEPKLSIAVDGKEKLKKQYLERLAAPMFAFHWLDKMERAGRLHVCATAKIPRGALVKLREIHFDTNDYFLIEAASQASKVIVTREFNSFTEGAQTILRRDMKIKVYSPADAIEFLKGKVLNPEPS